MVGGDPLVFSERFRFAVVHNDAAAFGLSAGAYTWPLNLALTLAAIVLMVPVARDLARIDDAAPRALGLIVGGALGNFASLLFSPPGVVDFISIGFGAHSNLVLNVADVAAYVGLAMMPAPASSSWRKSVVRHSHAAPFMCSIGPRLPDVPS
jgi:lipoprotein signal peptidase